MSARRDSDDDLAARQAQVVAALTGIGEVPDGFDTRHLEIARRALLRKRANELRFVWPILVASLGPALNPLFAEFARERPTGGARADGHAFAQWLRRRGELPLAASLELAEARLSWTFPPEKAAASASTGRAGQRERPAGMRMPTRRTSPVAVERFPGGMLVRHGSRVRTIGRPRQR